jgi:hypothetical protein
MVSSSLSVTYKICFQSHFFFLSFFDVYTYAQVKRADEAKLAGSKRSKNQGSCQAQDWSVERKEDVSSWEGFLGTTYN